MNLFFLGGGGGGGGGRDRKVQKEEFVAPMKCKK